VNSILAHFYFARYILHPVVGMGEHWRWRSQWRRGMFTISVTHQRDFSDWLKRYFVHLLRVRFLGEIWNYIAYDWNGSLTYFQDLD